MNDQLLRYLAALFQGGAGVPAMMPMKRQADDGGATKGELEGAHDANVSAAEQGMNTATDLETGDSYYLDTVPGYNNPGGVLGFSEDEWGQVVAGMLQAGALAGYGIVSAVDLLNGDKAQAAVDAAKDYMEKGIISTANGDVVFDEQAYRNYEATGDASGTPDGEGTATANTDISSGGGSGGDSGSSASSINAAMYPEWLPGGRFDVVQGTQDYIDQQQGYQDRFDWATGDIWGGYEDWKQQNQDAFNWYGDKFNQQQSKYDSLWQDWNDRTTTTMDSAEKDYQAISDYLSGNKLPISTKYGTLNLSPIASTGAMTDVASSKYSTLGSLLGTQSTGYGTQQGNALDNLQSQVTTYNDLVTQPGQTALQQQAALALQQLMAGQGTSQNIYNAGAGAGLNYGFNEAFGKNAGSYQDSGSGGNSGLAWIMALSSMFGD